MALIVGLGGSLGVYSGGRLVDHYRQRDSKWLQLPAFVNLITLPFGLVFLFAESSTLSLICLFPFYTLANFFIPAIHTVNQSLAKVRMRSTASAIVLLIISIVGAGAGPFVVGLLSDLFASRYSEGSIRYSLLWVVIVGFTASLFFYVSSRFIAKDLKRLAEK